MLISRFIHWDVLVLVLVESFSMDVNVEVFDLLIYVMLWPWIFHLKRKSILGQLWGKIWKFQIKYLADLSCVFRLLTNKTYFVMVYLTFLYFIHICKYILYKSLFPRNLSVIENIIAVMMAMCVGALGALVLAGEFYYDIWMFIFCFIMAGCQYSLIKSVQPDAASPMHVSTCLGNYMALYFAAFFSKIYLKL